MSLLSAASGGDPATFDRMLSQVNDNKVEFNVINAEDRSTDKAMTRTSIGFLVMFVMLGSGFTSMIVLKEKRDRTYHRICSAPVSSRQYIYANSLTGLIICILQIVMIQLIMKFVFRIDAGMSDFHLFIILLMFALVAVGLGLLITAFSSSSYMAGTLNTLVLTPYPPDVGDGGYQENAGRRRPPEHYAEPAGTCRICAGVHAHRCIQAVQDRQLTEICLRDSSQLMRPGDSPQVSMAEGTVLGSMRLWSSTKFCMSMRHF